MTVSMKGSSFKFKSQIELLFILESLVETYPAGGDLTFTADDGDTFTHAVPANGDTEGFKAFFNKHLGWTFSPLS